MKEYIIKGAGEALGKFLLGMSVLGSIIIVIVVLYFIAVLYQTIEDIFKKRKK